MEVSSQRMLNNQKFRDVAIDYLDRVESLNWYLVARFHGPSGRYTKRSTLLNEIGRTVSHLSKLDKLDSFDVSLVYNNVFGKPINTKAAIIKLRSLRGVRGKRINKDFEFHLKKTKSQLTELMVSAKSALDKNEFLKFTREIKDYTKEINSNEWYNRGKFE